MDRTGGSTTVAVTAEEVKSTLSKARTLTSEEEKVLRLRHGAGLPDGRAPLARAAGANEELADELLLIEMQLIRAFRSRHARPVARAPTARNATREKIIRGLRKKR